MPKSKRLKISPELQALQMGVLQMQVSATELRRLSGEGNPNHRHIPKVDVIYIFCKRHKLEAPKTKEDIDSWIIRHYLDENFKYLGPGVPTKIGKFRSVQETFKLKKKREEKRLTRNPSTKKSRKKKLTKRAIWWTKYNTYLKSPEWKFLREVIFRMRGKKCEKCESTKVLQLHHLTYKNVFKEKYEDLQILCRSCHEKEHDKQFSHSKNNQDSSETSLSDSDNH